MVDTYMARRRLEIEPGVWREPGELLPEAHTWFLIDSLLHTGYVVETTASPAEFAAAVAAFCPAMSTRVLELAGLDATLHGPRRTPQVSQVAQPRKTKAASKAEKPSEPTEG